MKKLLIADDDKAMLGLVTTLLRLEGYQTVTETEANKVLNTIQEHQPDLVILDVHVAGEDTLDIVKELKADPALEKTPVMMISGMELRDQCLALGADDFILKPFHPQELLNRIAPLVNRDQDPT